jgi:hypothetical protein
MKRGDVVEVDWQYTDMSGSKLRPAVVVGGKRQHLVRNCGV